MQFDLTNPLDKERFKKRCNALYAKGAVVEMTERAFRSPNQNRYLHLLIGVVAMETGVSLEFAKQEYFKRLCNGDVFIIEREDKFIGKVETLRSTSALTKEEMSIAIDRFKRWASEQGMYLPDASDESLLKEIEIQMGRLRQYM